MPPVQIREEVSALFAFAKKIEIDRTRAELLVETAKTAKMILSDSELDRFLFCLLDGSDSFEFGY